jgi:hypothetical protein
VDFRRMLRLTPVVCACLLAASPLQAHHKNRFLRFVCPSPIIISGASDSGSALVQLTNDGIEPVDLALTSEDFKSAITGQYVGARIKLTDEDGKKLPEHKALRHGEFQLVKVSVENVWQAGESVAKFCNDGNPIGSLSAIKYHFPFAVSLDQPRSGTPEIVAVQNQTLFLAFKNADALTYPIGWRLIVGGERVGGGRLTLAPNATLSAPVSPRDAWYPNDWVTRPLSALKPRETDGRIELCFRPDPGHEKESQAGDDDDCDRALAAGGGLYPTDSIPVKVRLQYWPDKLQSFWGYCFIVLVVLVGSLTSVLSSYGIPNVLSRLDLKEKLALLGRHVSAISSAVDSRLRVQLGTQRQQINDAVRSHYWFSPDQPETLKLSGAELDALGRRVTLTEELDSIRQRYDALVARNMPPSLRSRADTLLQIAAELLTNPRSSDEDLAKAGGLVDEAAQTLYKVRLAVVEGEGIADLLKDMNLAARLNEVKDDFSKLGLPEPRGVASVLSAAVKEVFAGLIAGVDDPEDDPDAQPPPKLKLILHYVHQDFHILKLELLRDYVRLRLVSRGSNLDNLLNSEDRLLQLLDGDCWGDLQSARLLLSGMQCNVYPANLEKAVRDGKFAIVPDRPVLESNQAVRFAVRFDKTELNGPAALEQLDYAWEFIHPSWDRRWGRRIRSWWERRRLLRRKGKQGGDVEPRRLWRSASPTDEVIQEGGKSVWFAWHYFPNACTYSVRISISGPRAGTADPTKSAGTDPGEVWTFGPRNGKKEWPFIRDVEVSPPESKSMQRAGAELLRFVLAFGAALITLISGARTQIVKLDMAAAIVALWGLGFTSDAMKNLISQGPAASVASARRAETPPAKPPDAPSAGPSKAPSPSNGPVAPDSKDNGPNATARGGHDLGKAADAHAAATDPATTGPATPVAKDKGPEAAPGAVEEAPKPFKFDPLSAPHINFEEMK